MSGNPFFNLTPLKYRLINNDNGKEVAYVECYGVIPPKESYITVDNNTWEVVWTNQVTARDQYGCVVVRIDVAAKKIKEGGM